MTELRSSTLLALKRTVHVVPRDGTVALVRDGHPPISLGGNGYPVLVALERLQAGTTYGSFVAACFSGDEARAAALVTLLLNRELLMVPVSEDDAPDPSERDRYDRLLAYFAEYERPDAHRYDFLARVRRAHVMFLGLGSMTSWVLGHLAACGVGRITGVDPDCVELSNLARQAFYGEPDIGTPKTAATARTVTRLNTGTRFEGVQAQLASPADARRELDGADRPDLVVLTADQPLWLIAEWVSTACAALGLNLLRVNVQSVGPLYIGAGTACPACELVRLRRSPGAEALLAYRAGSSYRSMFNSATISTEIAIQGTLAAHEAIGLLSGAWQPQSVNGSLRLSPPPSYGAVRRPLRANPDCPACGGR